MTSKLPINLEDLLHQRKVEGERIEYKTGWNPDPIMRTLCAFANDFENLGGGYVVIGQDCEEMGMPIFPLKGLPNNQLDRIQLELLGFCNQIQANYLKQTVVKHPDRAKVDRFWNYPYAAIEETVVNAVYHRSYDIREPIEVRITPEDLVVLSFPGPDRSIRMADLQKGKAVSRRYRNRRIGEFLKELDLTEGRSTGISKILKVMKGNHSPAPEFETDGDRTYFLIRLPVHPGTIPVESGQVDTTETTPEKTSGKTSGKILSLMRENPKVSIPEIAESIGRTARAIEMQVAQLKAEGLPLGCQGGCMNTDKKVAGV
ncbi:MAG: winged helix-turn-helix transcriptional regulator [Methanosarcinales archaeon]|nr:winged helix-turn-helix transcriptional regulator [Methanosarcinales archaeon]